jgi:hypothetical protein
MKRNTLKQLTGREPMGFRGKSGIVTAKVDGRWFDSITMAVRHRSAGSDVIVEGVDLSKPLTASQVRDMVIYG